jgi:hypothetical protein
MEYSLEFLEDKFKEHAERFRLDNEKMKKNREENDYEQPDYDYEFNLPLAFVTIIQEIRALKGD